MSHPVWVRGLKLLASGQNSKWMVSHPVWVRGLKHGQQETERGVLQVAPRVGAWIETSTHRWSADLARVAPRVGAWIETV